MGCRRLSKTIAPGTRHSTDTARATAVRAAVIRTGAVRAAAVRAPAVLVRAVPAAIRSVAALAVVILLSSPLFLTGCSGPEGVAATPGAKLEHGIVYLADLDGDGACEQVVVDGTPGTLIITDGGTVYRSRDKWRVVEAHLGDTDHNGVLEVVALLDSDEGRHLGLFAHFGGRYRERLVTSELDPRPLSLEIVPPDRAPAGPDGAPASDGDLVLLILEPAPGRTDQQSILCRWNGFGFTGLGPLPPE